VGLFDKAKHLAEEHADQVSHAIDKVAAVVDDKTGGKYADKIDKGAAAAKNFVDGDGDGGAGGGPPSAGPTPAP
jgi:hypothetical protein